MSSRRTANCLAMVISCLQRLLSALHAVECELDIAKSGATIAYSHFNPRHYPTLRDEPEEKFRTCAFRFIHVC